MDHGGMIDEKIAKVNGCAFEIVSGSSTRIIESLHDPAKAMTARYAPSAKAVT
jgi:hypothetical protein